MILFVGDRPSPKMKPGAKPFEGAACETRLKEWIFYIAGDEEFRIVNQCDFTYLDIRTWHQVNHKVVTLGHWAALACEHIPHFELPHPSGLNRQINDKEFVLSRLKECREWIKKS